MTMTGPTAIEAMIHVMRPERIKVAVWIGDKRYGGFSSYDHIAFFLKQQGLTFADARIEDVKGE